MSAVAAVDAVVSIAGQGSEQAVLERLVEVSLALSSARYGVAVLVGADGQACALAHQGMTDRQAAALPHLPGPVGLIGVVLRGTALRLPDLAAHPESVGFPAGHVPMTALLAVPVQIAGRVLGGLYLTRGPDQGEFTGEDEQAAQAAARLAGATLHALRQSGAHEDLLDRLGATDVRHTDSPDPAEVSPAIRRLLDAARQVLGMDLTFLSRLHDGTQTFSHVSADDSNAAGSQDDSGVREGRLALAEGTTGIAADGYCMLMVDGQIPSSVPDVAAHPLLGPMAVTAALGVGGYCGVPVHLPGGALYGSLCGLHPVAGTAPSAAQLDTLRILARLIGVRLQREAELLADRLAAVTAFGPLLDGTRRRIVLQPIVDLVNGVTVGFEALSRFSEPAGAPRRPDEVFARAHTLDLGVRLERAAAADALALLPDLPAGTYLSVNLSPQAVLDPPTIDLLTGALASGAAGRLVLELTEHEHVPDYPALLRVLAGLRERGLRLAVDDTGSGFASLQHVTLLGPDIVKLDIAFVRDVDTDPSRRAVARAMIAFAGDLGATLIAEGIETAAERDELRRLGAALGQGYHLGRPQPAEQALSAAGRDASSSAA